MKALFKPLYLLIITTLLVVVLVLFYFFGGSSPTPSSIIRIARDPLWSSLDFQDKARQFLAFSDSLIEEIAKREDLQIQFMDDSSDDLFPLLQRREVTGVITIGYPAPPVSSENFLYSDGFYDLGVVLVTRSDSKIRGLDDVKGHVVGILRGTVAPSQLGLDPTVFIVSYDTPLMLLGRLVDQTIDAALMPYLSATSLGHGLYRGQVRIASAPVVSNEIRLATNRNSAGQELIDHFNNGLEAVHEDGTYDRLLHKWGLPDPQKLEEEQRSEVKSPIETID